jgi:photosystem II stability/assembly factor-like uncharacterized protein
MATRTAKTRGVPRRSGRAPAPRALVMVGTRKGAFLFRSDAGRAKWRVTGPIFLGQIVHHVVLDPRDGATMLMASRTGHLGPTVFRSTDGGATWAEAARPPAFGKGASGRVVDHVFWLTPGHASEPGVWYAGSSPQGLFRSVDGGVNWDGVAGFNEHPQLTDWIGGDQDGTPDGPKMHSINVDPRDAGHLYISMSGGGTFESTDRGATWRPLNKGVEAPGRPPPPDGTEYEYGHDPHCMFLHPRQPDRLYQQNHCGIYRLDRPGERWTRIGASMPEHVGDVGFPIVLHPRDPDTVWVFPMDGGTVWPRTSIDGKPAAYRTRDGGTTWVRQDRGLPRAQAWFTVKRQAMCADAGDPVGVYFGTTGGEIWASTNEGASWKCIAQHLPHVYSVTAALV